jgi:4-diphosphocytidyl-2-C-methyl-D-erythritol kinase
MTEPLTVRAPAKINLHLGVGAIRDDGFHPLDTVYQAIGLYDDLTARPRPGWRVDIVPAAHISAEALPASTDNLVSRAGQLLADLHGVPLVGRVEIVKDIPVAGGMAGGSADAAAVLVALDRLWGAETTDEDLLRIAAELGSDVPFALVGGSARGTGRGEVVERVEDSGTWWWVVVPSRVGLSTPAVYRRFDELAPSAASVPAAPTAVLDALAEGSALALAAALHNDLEPAALDLRPELSRLIEAGEREGALRGLVSGSGPTVVFLAESAEAARVVAGALADDHEVVLVANGAVAGAHIVPRRVDS